MATAPRNIYEQQAANRRNTVLVMAVFTLFVGLLGLGFDVFILGFPGDEYGVDFPYATVIALVIGTGSALWSLQVGAKSVLASSTAVPILHGDPRYQQLSNVVDEMSIASGLQRPALYLIADPDPNAFATGKDPEHASIAVTQGLLDQMSRDELQAVIAHEMSHVRNYDIRLMTVVAALLGAVALLSEFGLRSMRFGALGGKKSSSRKGGGGIVLLVLWLIALVLAPLVSRLLAMAVSRQREYLADASGAELTRNPAALASALQKIDAAIEPTRLIKKGTAQLCIGDPLGAAANDSEGFLADLFATHPPMRNRITLLKAMAYQQTGVIRG
ncbi:MAG: HtpX-2 peptidase [Bacteroidetes bacterium]|nr:HtpX-2 peptidase [Bacteroidota bacterium]